MGREMGQRELEAVLKYLEQRASRLVRLIQAVSQPHSEKKVRDGGAQLTERIVELAEELREMQSGASDELAEAADLFHRRLYIAEQMVETWNIPAAVRKQLEPKRVEQKARAPRRRGRRPKKQAA